MLDNRTLRSPALVLLAGLLATALAHIVMYSGPTASRDELTRSTAVGLISACGATCVAILQRMAHHRTSESLTQARHDANHDALTGLVNRTELYRQLHSALRKRNLDNAVVGVLFLDLDRFKIVNDTIGHDAGDELLKKVADRLRSSVRSTDTVARVGGDEFVVICPELLTEESVTAVARQILKRFAEPVNLRGRQQRISTSIGVTMISGRDDDRTPEDIVRDADTAMYRAKRNRCGYALFDEQERSSLLHRLSIERDLNRALIDNQLEVHYQPVIDASAATIHGFEALVRWRHPERGMLSPGLFLPVAAEAGLMSKIGEVVLREACAQAAAWNHLLPPDRQVRIGVNVAEQQLIDPRIASTVAEVLAWSRLDPSLLVLEITEDVLVEHLGTLDTLRALRDLGVELAIDDFGTGQSSLSYIRQFDMVSTLKIDQSFVRDMDRDPASRAIVEAIVTMASALGLSIVAEGVERWDQAEALDRLGVGLMQGYLFSRPQPIEEMADPQLWPTGAGLLQFATSVGDATHQNSPDHSSSAAPW